MEKSLFETYLEAVKDKSITTYSVEDYAKMVLHIMFDTREFVKWLVGLNDSKKFETLAEHDSQIPGYARNANQQLIDFITERKPSGDLLSMTKEVYDKELPQLKNIIKNHIDKAYPKFEKTGIVQDISKFPFSSVKALFGKSILNEFLLSFKVK